MPSTSSVLYYFTARQLLDLEVAHKNANTVKQGKSAYFLPILIVVIAIAALSDKYKYYTLCELLDLEISNKMGHNWI